MINICYIHFDCYIFNMKSAAAVKNLRNVYLHFPFCNRKCSYCDFPVHALGTP